MAIESRCFGELFAEPTRNGLTRPKAVRGVGVKMVNMGELFAYSRINNVPMDRVPLSDSEAQRFLLRKGDLLFARQSLVLEGAGKCSIFLGDEEPVTFESHVTRVRLDPGKADPFFYFYYLQSHHGRSTIASIVEQGAGASGIRGSDLSRLDVLWRPLPEQRAIAHILGTLDDKIELNRKQNETLEAMARALFKAWFVDFEPVRAKMEGRWQRGQSLPGLPAHLYELFPDRLVESELGEIPEGWRVFSFGDVAQQGKGTVNPTDEPEERFTHYSIPAFDAGKMPVIELGGSIKSNKTPVPDGAVLVSKLNPHIPRVWLVGQAGNRAVCSTEFIVWTPKPPANSAFLYCLASSPEFVDSMCQLVTGTSNSHQRVKPDQLREIRVFAANDNVIDAFSRIVESLMNQVLQNGQQSRILAQLRDTLLPKLISGELRIADAEAFLKGRG